MNNMIVSKPTATVIFEVNPNTLEIKLNNVVGEKPEQIVNEAKEILKDGE